MRKGREMGYGFVGGQGWPSVRANGARTQVRRWRPMVCMSATGGVEVSSLHLTPELEETVNGLSMFSDPKVRYQQLLHLASKLKPMDASLKTPENKVPGCLSTVYVSAMRNPEDEKIYYEGDSDAQLTKGLVALLVNGLSGYTKEDIAQVKPEFIQASGLSVSLTPGRNNGFLNMFKLMKAKAQSLCEEASSEEVEVTDEMPDKPVCSSILRKLRKLQPTSLEVIDFSEEHAGHASKPDGGETHIRVHIKSHIFEGMSLVKRHQLIYTLLNEEMQGSVHALQIDAKTPDE
eukprot:Plantae.Rhodophyta-Purpureofilum_apyrenoidigerum.ctg27451.p1 GENE.Plantae.Rhodophyta-Purpureofilum_apyrenoidigerum.ctg27451~~Plantae.Rhodophyta-Purpureofilum_apyrenoidigerum.ctg27451.p1  ORF type:complete len:290 (-),score=51.68 Plantae.Rhodophyta-Purpureofilum_apyrenoidigerum.ctg27451:273-1142(-)